ncbi:MAG TPA: class I SAM-dependent methyltransferase [Dehalococcoidia bacterium]|nr:class I SAM-dependent methyltransferase [Dehalococcoidia bacterium]
MPLPASAAETPRRLFTPIAANYDRPAQLLGLLQYRRWHDFLLSRLDLPPRARVLDMATGTGALALRLARRDGFRVTGADITRPMLLQAATRANGRLDPVECTAEASPFADGAFDAVVFSYLLRYVADVPATLAGLARLVRPGGTMASLDFAVPRGGWYPLWRLYTAVGLPLGGALLSPAWRRVGAFLGPSIRGFYRRWPEERLLRLWRECGFPDARARRLSLGGAIVTWGTKRW